MNTHRLTPLQALTIADKGGQEHRDTDRLTPLQALAIADTGGQGHRRATPSLSYRGLQKNYFNILIGKYFNRKIFFTGTHRQEDRTPTQATGSPLLARSPSRSMMMHRKGNEHSQGHRNTGTPTGSLPYRLLPLPTGGQDTGGTPTQGDRLAPVGSRSLSVYDDTPQRK